MLCNSIVIGLPASWYRLHVSIDEAKNLFLPGNLEVFLQCILSGISDRIYRKVSVTSCVFEFGVATE